jgi:hypothetical protein
VSRFRRSGRLLSGLLTAAVVAPVGLLLSGATGLPRNQVKLASGGAWLASPGQGLVTLIDGASEQVVGALRAPAAKAGDPLSVVQDGTSAFVANPAQGTVSRVDGGTYEASAAVQFAAPGRGLVAVLAGGPGLYVVDGQRRLASVADPRTLAVRTKLSLAARPGPDQSVVDSAGRLWVVDSGGLTWFDGGQKHVRTEVGDAGSRLVLVRGQPVLVDPRRRRLGRVGGDGTVGSWSCLDVRADDGAQVLGSSVAPRVYGVVPQSGSLVIGGLDQDDCATSVEVGRPGDDFGPLVEVGRFVFVPNRTSGRTVVVEVAAHQVVANLDVVAPGAKLELTAKDGLVFYNDLDGDRAGVIRFDGQAWRQGKALRKYDKADLGAGILTPAGQQGADKRPSPDRPDKPATPTQPRPEDPAPTTLPSDGQAPPLPGPPVVTGPQLPQPPGPPPPGASAPSTSDSPPAAAPVIQGITVNPPTVVRDQAATFSATVDNAPTGWHWVITDAAGTTLFESTDAGQTTYTPPAGTADDLTVTLTVSNAAGEGAPKSVPFQTTSSLTPQVNGPTASSDAPGIGEQVTFTASEAVAGDRGAWAWSVTSLDTGAVLVDHQAGDTGAPFRQGFDTAGRFRVTLSVSFDGATGTGSADVTVVDRCALTVTSGTVDLTGNTREGTATARWSNCQAGFQPPTVTLPPWLKQTSLTVSPAGATGTASVGVQLQDTPPNAADQPGVIVFTSGAVRVGGDVRLNAAPRLFALDCFRQPHQQTTIQIKVDYGNVDGVPGIPNAVMTMPGVITLNMNRTVGSSPPLYSTVVSEDGQSGGHVVPDGAPFSITVFDEWGRSDTVNATVSQCST